MTREVEDCISRAYIEPIIEELENICVNSDEHILDLLADIKNAPSVTPQQRIGHWNIVGVLHGEWEGTKKYACDKCGEKVGVFKSNFCPNCGAKMEGVKDES